MKLWKDHDVRTMFYIFVQRNSKRPLRVFGIVRFEKTFLEGLYWERRRGVVDSDEEVKIDHVPFLLAFLF